MMNLIRILTTPNPITIIILNKAMTCWNSLQQTTLNHWLIDSLVSNGFVNTMPVQQAAIPLLLKNYDLAVEAQTGSGKTLAFVVPLLQRYIGTMEMYNHRLEQDNQYSVPILYVILSPTRQLCQQTYECIIKLINNLPNGDQLTQHVKMATGGNQLQDDINNVREETVVLVGTVGRLRELSNHYNPNWLRKVQYLYIDEADRVLKEKGINELIRMFQKVRRTAMFSATLQAMQPKDYEFYGMRNLAKISVKALPDKQVQLESNPESASYVIPGSLTNTYLSLPNRKCKIVFLFVFLSNYLHNTKTIIFFNTCASVDFYSKLLIQFFRREDHEASNLISGIHGKLKNKKRAKILERFRSAKNGCLIATDVVARGIDFDHVHYIVQIDPPEDPDNYIHRVGRTARINRPGTAILLIETHEQAFINYLKQKGVGVRLIEQPYKHFFPSWQPITQYNPQQQFTKQLDTKVLNIITSDRDYIQKSKKAFVSYIRSYKQHDLHFIFEFKHLSIGYTAQSFFLLRIPRIKQILGRKIHNFTQKTIDIQDIPWADRNQQMQYEAKRNNIQQRNQQQIFNNNNNKLSNYRNSSQIKNNKSLRKKLKMRKNNQELMQLNRDYQEIKNTMKGKVVHRLGTNRVISSDEDDTEQIEKKISAKYGITE